jgi:pappalysin-1
VVVAQGGRKSFEITPNQGYRIADVEVDGKSVGPKKSYPFNDVSINHTISASFKQRPPYERFAFNPQRRNLQIRSEFLSNPGRQITLEAWFKTEALGTRQAIITKLHPEFKKREPYYQFNLELRQTGQLYFALAIGGKRRWIDNAFLVYPNRWYHVAATYDGKIMRLYLNGEEWGEPYFKEGNLSVYGMPLVIGGESSDRPFKGLLAEVRIWNVTRTKEEIISKMNETIPATSGLVFSSTNQ